MKAAAVILTALTVTLSGEARADARSARIDALKESFRYQSIAAIEPATASPSEEVVVLEKLTITESMSQRTLQNQITAKWDREAEERFSWKKGGLLSSFRKGDLDIEAGAWISFEDKLVGANPTREIVLKVELLRFKW